MKRLKRLGGWYWRYGQPLWIVWMAAMLIINAPGWIGQWWYIPAMLTYVGIITAQAYWWGYGRAMRRSEPILKDQLALLKKMSDETVVLPFVAVTMPHAPGEPPSLKELHHVAIRYPLSMN